MSAIKLNSSGGGSITISPASTASNLTLTAPAQTGTIGVAGPAFSAYASTSFAVNNNSWTKYPADIEVFDTDNCYNPSLARFTPNVAGYYWCAGMASSTGAATGYIVMALYKNGVSYNQFGYAAATSNFMNLSGVGCLVYLNGITDYAEWYINQVTGTNLTYNGGGTGLSLISANMVRAA